MQTKSILVFAFLWLAVQNSFSQRIFTGEIVTTENDTLRGRVWFSQSSKKSPKVKFVYFSDGEVKMKRLKAKKVATMNLVNKVTKEKYYFERKDNGSGAYLFSHSMSKEIGTMHGGGAAVTFSGDTIFGKYIQFPSMIVPIKGMGGKENQVAAFWYNDDEGYHFLERKTTSSGQAVFLEKITGGKLSHYQKLNKVYVGPGEGKVNGKTTKVYGWVTVRTDYVCKEGIGCDKIPSLGFKKFMQPYIKDCDIYLPAYRRSYFKALIKDYNKRCGEAADQKNKKK